MKRYILVMQACFVVIVSWGASDDFARNIHDYIWANYLQFDGRIKQANSWYKNILTTNSSTCTHKGYLCFLYETGNHRHIVQLMQRMRNLFDNDADIQLIFARSLRQEGHKQQAEELIIRLSNVFKKNIEIAFEATQIYIERKELENALHTMDDILNNSPKKPNFFIFYFLKAQIYAQLNEYAQAHTNIDMCTESNPHFDKGWLLKGIVKEQQGDIPEAIKGYKSYLETADNPDQKVQHHLRELFLRVNNAHNQQVFKHMGLFYYDIKHGNCIRDLQHKTYTYIYGLPAKKSMQDLIINGSIFSL